MADIGVALVGYGYAGRTFHQPLIRATAGLRLAMVVSNRPEAVAADLPGTPVAARLSDALADPGVGLVVIATPNDLHAEQAILALDAGKAVVVDKPFTITLTEAKAVAAAARRVDRPVFVFQNRRFDADFLTLRRWIGEGRLGEIVLFESHFDRWRPQIRDRWREQAGPGAGIWYDLGPHLIDQALQLFGAPVSVSCDIIIERPGGVADDAFRATLRYPSLRVALSASMLRADARLRLAVHGTKGSFVRNGLDLQEDQLKAGVDPRDGAFGLDPTPVEFTAASGDSAQTSALALDRGDYRAFYTGVHDALQGRGEGPVALSEAIDVVRVLRLGLVSSAQRREVAFDEPVD